MEAIRELLRRHTSFVLAGHINPDADSVGACYGLGMALSAMGKQVWVLLEPYNVTLNIIPGSHLRYEGLVDDLSPDVFVALDCGDVTRLGKAKALFARSPVTVCIDHHKTNPGFATHNCVDGEVTSTCEMLYSLLKPMTDLSAEVASALYAGMVQDTGGFRYGSVKPETLNIAAKLMGVGIPFTDIYNEMLYIHRFSAAKLMGNVLQTAVLTPCSRVVYACVTHAMLDQAQADRTDLDGVAEYLINISGVKVALLAYETANDGEVKTSFRSKSIGVDTIAQSMGGGGHRLAAGATQKGDLHELAQHALALILKELDA
jgi:phosphoesterase RecJ-like protein